MKATVAYDDYIKSELINQYGVDEIVDGNKIVAFDEDYSIIKMIMNFDKNVQEIINRRIFLGESLDNEEHDKEFKKIFLLRFMTRQIQQQTIEAHAVKVTSCFMKHRKTLEYYFREYEKMLEGDYSSSTNRENEGETGLRLAVSTLPQSELNLNLDDQGLSYADSNTIQKTRAKDEGLSTTKGSSFSVDPFMKLSNFLEPILREFDKVGFLHIFY